VVLIIGLVFLVAAVVVGVAGVLSNHGSGHALTHPFAVLGYHATGSTGRLFLYGIVVGAVALLGLSLLLDAARRTSRRGAEARLALAQSRRETAAASADRDFLLDQREAARADAASTPGNRPAGDIGSADEDGDGQRGSENPFRRRAASVQPAVTASGYAAGDVPVSEVPADASIPAADGSVPAK
jgi:hypothetical protein